MEIFPECVHFIEHVGVLCTSSLPSAEHLSTFGGLVRLYDVIFRDCKKKGEIIIQRPGDPIVRNLCPSSVCEDILICSSFSFIQN